MRVSAFLPVGLALGMIACSSNVPPPSPPTFGRPQRVAFVCMTADGTALRTLEECRPTVKYDGDTPTVTPSVYSLNALVTQSNRGEVAAVDLVKNQVIDARQDIPGYTFVPAGELPNAIVVPPTRPALTYVANAGSRDISVIKTLDFRHLPVRTQVTDVRVAVRPTDDQGAQAPFDMLLSPDEDALFVTAPAAGWLLRMPLTRCEGSSDPNCHEGQIDTAHIVRVPIEESLDKAPPAPPAQTDPSEPYSQICDPVTLVPQPVVATPQVGSPADRTPRPAGLALDSFCKTGETCQRRLIVADRNLPILHVIDIDVLAAGNASDSVLTPIVTGVPTERVAVSPRVPVDIAGTEETQYVYAIDMTDGSVLVAQNGQVISVSSDPTVRADRLDVGYSAASGKPVAQSLDLLYPGYDTAGSATDQNVTPTDPRPNGEWLCGDSAHITRTANRLRGVFLAVGLTDGTVRILDVFDAELQNCRSCDKTSLAYDPYPLHRHRPRIDMIYVQPASGPYLEPILTPTVTPQFQVGTSSIFVNSDGTTNDPRVPGLACVACTGKEAVSFPPADMLTLQIDAGVSGEAGSGAATDSGIPLVNDCAPGEGRVCSLADPWMDPFVWIANREGVIPGARGGLGRFVDAGNADNQTGSLEFAGEASFCSNGVLGDDDIGDVDGNGKPDGDQVLITSVLPDVDVAAQAGVTGSVRADCEALVAARDNDDLPIGFRIKQAYGSRLVIDPDAINQPPTVRTHVDYAFVNTCFLDSLLTYEVHARQSYIVVSTNGPGFLHTVVLDPNTQRCVIDKTKDQQRVGRAYDGAQFDNGFVSFKTTRAPAERDIGLSLAGTTNVPKLVMDATQVQGGTIHGVLPVQLKYSDIDQRLYLVDITLRGLIPIPLDNFPSAVLTSIQ
jgi:hypothetical protein